MQQLISTILLFVWCFTGFDAYSQGWEKTYGGDDYDSARSIVATSDGGFMTVGDSYSQLNSGTNDLYLVKTDALGNVLWEKYFGGSSSDAGYAIEKVSDGFIIAGYSASFAGGPSGYLLKVDENGTQLWARTFPKRIFKSVKNTFDGGFIIGGDGWDEHGNTDMWLIKTDASGSPQWEKSFGGTHGADYGRAAVQTEDGGYAMVGENRSSASGSADVFLVKVSGNGSTLWQKSYGGSDWDFGNDLAITCDGGFIISGISDSDATDRDIYLVKTDWDGNMQWEQRFGGPNYDHGNAVIQTKDGGYLVTGNNQEVGSDDLVLIKTDDKGNLIWEKNYGAPSQSLGYDIWQAEDGEYIIAGALLTGMKGYEVYLIKTDNLGVPTVDCNPAGQLGVKVYPNPFRSFATFEVKGIDSEDIIQLSLFDVSGKLVSHNSYAGPTFDIQVEGFPTGLYVFQIKTEQGKTKQGKLVIY
ncbi:MAG: T9SS type A sorting domain-containing protein [Saprospiraceae bacterium]|nr:T9SS type A sorting domain-containing protein [Saprospiraceae bacterium]MCF8251655.1 T9SS type A sorting domain-containing protein [Saprospiraceae bacterium]MCF8281065.1 T9SS type A sorting domain-containing protein [Bacteroidales bacterium]MCF8313274.1 T9SS type A sorting domain-containing protein [Saprospiraceae bacterium]MCF8442018.1 T9SS type A sorting domain-containing protein [Saprospiraceae bacterium]